MKQIRTDEFYFVIENFKPALLCSADYSLDMVAPIYDVLDFLNVWCDKWNFKKGILSLLRKNYGYSKTIKQDWVEYGLGSVLSEVPNP